MHTAKESTLHDGIVIETQILDSGPPLWMPWWVSSTAQAQTQRQLTGLQHARKPQAHGKDGRKSEQPPSHEHRLGYSSLCGAGVAVADLLRSSRSPRESGGGPLRSRSRSPNAAPPGVGGPGTRPGGAPGPFFACFGFGRRDCPPVPPPSLIGRLSRSRMSQRTRWAGVREYRICQCPGIIQTCLYQNWKTPLGRDHMLQGSTTRKTPFRPPYGTRRGSSSVKRGGHAQLLRLHKALAKPDP